MTVTIETIADALRGWNWDLSSEERTQQQIALALDRHMIPFEREKKLSDRDRLDFLCHGGIAIEAKLKGQARAVHRQIQRYCERPEVKSVILVTARTMGMPKEIAGKRVVVFPLGRGML